MRVLVDGRSFRPGTARTAHNYSSKRPRQGLNIEVADATLLAVSAPVAGRRPDRRAITGCGLAPALDNHTWYADAAYIGTCATVPFKRSKHHAVTGYDHPSIAPFPPDGPQSNAPSATSRCGERG